MRRRDREDVAEFIQRHLLLHRVGELGTDFIAGERPLHFHATEVLDELFLEIDQLWLLVTEIEAVAQTEARHAVLSVERREGNLLTERQLREHDRQVNVVRPVEHARAMREGKRIRSEATAGTDERDLGVKAAVRVAIEEEALLLAVRL